MTNDKLCSIRHAVALTKGLTSGNIYLSLSFPFILFLGLILPTTGCSLFKPPIQDIPPVTDGVGCDRPSSHVGLNHNEVEIAGLNVGDFALGKVDFKAKPELRELMTKAANDLTVVQYLKCVAIKRGDIDKDSAEQKDYVETKFYFMRSNPTPEQIIMWQKDNPFPGKSDNEKARKISQLEQDIRQHISQGYYADALKESIALVSIDDKSALAQKLKGIAHFKLGEFGSAIAEFKMAKELDVTLSDTMNYNIAAALISLGNNDSAIDILNNLKSRAPDDMRLNYNLGLAHLLKKDYTLAKQCYSLVYNAGGTKKPSAALGLGFASLLEKETDQAQKQGINYLQEAVCLKPEFRGLFMNHSVEDNEEKYDLYLKVLPLLKDSTPFKTFKREMKDGKIC